MKKLHPKLLTTLGLGWLAFGIVGSAIAFALPPAQITVLIDRSFCPQDKWQAIARNYDEIYQQYQQYQNRELQIEQVVAFNNIGQEVLSGVPTPDEVRSLRTFGSPNQERKKQLQSTYPKYRLLSCQSQ